MSTIVTRSGKGSPLTNTEVDANFTNLNTDKAELSGAVFTGAITTNSTIDGRDVAADGVTADAALPKSGGAMTGAITTNSTFDGVDIATRDAVLTSTTTTANAALPKAGGAMTGAITTNSTFDGRDVATDGTKLDGIEASATADQTGAQIKTAYEAETNAFTDAQFTKLSGIEASATADQTAAEIRALVESATDSNVFTDADHTKLNGVEASADVTDTANVTAAGALMDSELTSIVAVKALNQGVATGDSPDFAALNVNGTATVDGLVVANTGAPSLRVQDTDGTNQYIDLGNNGGITSYVSRNNTTHGSHLFYGHDGTTFSQRFNIANNGDISFYEDTGTTAKLFWDASAESLGIGIAPSKKLTVFGTGVGNATVQIEGEGGADPYINFLTNNAQHWSLGVDDSDGDKFKLSEHSALGTNDYLTVDVTGNVLVGKDTDAFGTAGIVMRQLGVINITRASGSVLNCNRTGSDGALVAFHKNSTTVVGSIGVANNNNLTIGGSVASHAGFEFGTNMIIPFSGGAQQDAAVDIGYTSIRFKNIYRSGSTYSTSDRNMKQDIRDLTDAERKVAVACKGLLKAFRFIDTVEKDGDDANIHFGIIAQELAEAFEAEGLDANDYQLYKSATYTDDNDDEQTRLNVCYENLLAFIISAI